MTSKEYIKAKLEYLIRYEPSLSFDIDMFEQVLKALERLETLEKENKRLNKLLIGYQCNTFNEAQENVDLREENKKLKKMIDNKIDILSKQMSEITDCDDVHLIMCDIIEELKEVLGE